MKHRSRGTRAGFVVVLLTSISVAALADVEINNDFYRDDKKNPFYPQFVGQCTWFVYGRIHQENFPINDKLFRGNAPDWLSDAANAGYFIGSTPAQHAIACWKSIGQSGYGHVAFVEDDLGNVTESNIGPAATKLIVVMRDNDEVYYEDKVIGQRLKLQLGSPVPKPVRLSMATLWKLEEYETNPKTGKVEWGRVDTVEFAKWLQGPPNNLVLPTDKQRIWFKRDWQVVKGNFTGIRLTLGAANYIKTFGNPKYIYLDRQCALGTGADLCRLRQDVGLDQPVVAIAKEGAILQLIDGPRLAGKYTWWKLKCQNMEGWVATEIKANTMFEAIPNGMVEITSKLLWFHGAVKAHGAFYVAVHDNILRKAAGLSSAKIRDLPVGTENIVIGGPVDADSRVWWNLVVEKDTGWAAVNRWGFTYPPD